MSRSSEQAFEAEEVERCRAIMAEKNGVFVFGSNLGGRHGAGAAHYAATHYGARRGIGLGPTGRCYAIPTKTSTLVTLSLNQINSYVRMFLQYAADHPEKQFAVTRVGCGRANYQDAQIAPFFFASLKNVRVSPRWVAILRERQWEIEHD